MSASALARDRASGFLRAGSLNPGLGRNLGVMRHLRTAVIAAAGALLAVAGLAAWAVAGNGSSGGVAVPVVAAAIARAGTPPPPPRGALVLARGRRGLAVALAARRAGGDAWLTATVVAPDGSGLRGLHVRFAVDGKPTGAASPCGAGCYAASATGAAHARRVSIELSGAGRANSTVAFALPSRWPVSARPLLRRAERVFRALHSVTYREVLSSGVGAPEDTRWRSEAPDRISYRTTSGNAGVVIGRQRWDLVVGGGWKASPQNPPLALPAVPWGAGAYDVNVLGRTQVGGRAVVRVSLYEPATPAWYTIALDRATLRPLMVDMTATAHFMRDRYVSFNAPGRIRPPLGD
jgi:hypothetical protein